MKIKISRINLSKGFTLIELAISASIIGVGLLVIILTSAKTRETAVKNMIKELAFGYAQSRLNQIMALAFTDPTLGQELNDTPSNFYGSHLAYGGHPYKFSLSSGIYSSGANETNIPSGAVSLVTSLNEDEIGWKQIYSQPRINASNPFPVANTTPETLKNYIGKEYDDFNYFLWNDELLFYLNAEQVRRMTFPANKGYGLAMADDVDDFDGCWYTVNNVYNDVNLTIEVAVRPHFRNFVSKNDITITTTTSGSLTYTYNPTSDALPSKAFDDMGEISCERFLKNGLLNNLTDDAQLSVAQIFALQLYHWCVFKEIVVTVSWVYPQGTPPKSITIFGLKPGPNKDIVNIL